MNRQNLLSFRAYLAGVKPDRFRMADWFTPCRTAACLAGHAWWHFENGREFGRRAQFTPFSESSRKLREYCQEKFGFTKEQALTVFQPFGGYRPKLAELTLKEALYVWDRIIETNDVRFEFWLEAREETEKAAKQGASSANAQSGQMAADG